MKLVTLNLTEEQAILIAKVKDHHTKLAILMAHGVFDVKNGKAILNFDSEGTLRTVVIEEVVFKQ